MIIKFNGKNTKIKEKTTVEELLIKNNINLNVAVVLYNREVLEKINYKKEIEGNSTIEVLTFTGGG